VTFITQVGLIPNTLPADGIGVTSFWLQGLAGLIIGVLLLFAPTIIAQYRNHPKKDWIFAFNFLVGWTGIGWLVLLLKSLGPKHPIRSAEEYRQRYPLPREKTADTAPILEQTPNTSDAGLTSSSPSPSNPTIIASAILGGPESDLAKAKKFGFRN
jgi:hypothetical protein